ncbi:hypothetical protein BCL76_104352 [Streptomyces sp. CG 926]|nr:hypothetical protein BCL76_104352 [Streptomyces sp. CG 926]
MAVVVMQHAAGQAPPAVSRVLAAAGLTSRTVPLAGDADRPPTSPGWRA